MEPDTATLEMYEDRIAALGYEPVGFKTFKRLCDWISRGRRADLIVADRSSFPGSQCAAAVHASLRTVPVIIIGEANHNVPTAGPYRFAAKANVIQDHGARISHVNQGVMLPEPQKNLLLNAEWRVYLARRRAPGGRETSTAVIGGAAPVMPSVSALDRRSPLRHSAAPWGCKPLGRQACTGVIFAPCCWCLPVHQHLRQIILLSTAARPLC
ncbi:hypothetical protein [Sinorhizobium sp. 8-89]|uniref:hypothetical protein n=1 Tax=Sinorhizobium sp. 8-89 TaxID=3049089 RepID=UPI0024C45577|nr:hypothetical protein [Sinorhizobium sp. 8-89]